MALSCADIIASFKLNYKLVGLVLVSQLRLNADLLKGRDF